jgi:molybdopterin/thiamine biosynthesis adenylyltransferase/rhodanese-related sulfurtransferase
MDYRQLVEHAKTQVGEISPEELERDHDRYTVVDVRELDERTQGTIPGSVFVPRGILERDIARAVPDQSTRLALFCAAGQRSALAALSLQAMGYTDVVSLAGGFERWKREGRGWAEPGGLTTEQRVRYDRHLKLPEIGEDGQRRLLAARALVIGAGGLGSPVLLYLAAAGIGTISVIDGDRVDTTNLQRQVIHDGGSLGELKVESARARLLALNPEVKIDTHAVRLTAGNAIELLADCDVIVDGADNFPTRYLVNDASLRLRTPVVHGSIFRFEGQATVFSPYEGPCYRCLFPTPPPPELAPSCAEAGVLGALPGIIGSVQAVETVKLLLGIGRPLIGRLATYDALEQEWTTLRFDRDPDCPACSDESSPPTLVDYDETCAVPV